MSNIERPKKIDFAEVARNLNSQLRQRLEKSRAYDHPTASGDEREDAVKKVLGTIIPDRFGIEKGKVFDVDGNMSKEIDLIIFDKNDALFPQYEIRGRRVIPAESVYAVIEVKTFLNETEFGKSLQTFKTLEPLRRHYVHTDHLSDFKEDLYNRLHNGIGFFESFPLIGKPFSIIFAYDAVQPETLADLLPSSPDYLAMICIPHREFIIQWIRNLPNDDDRGYKGFRFGEDSLGAMSWGIADFLAGNARSKHFRPDVSKYREAVTSQLPGREDAWGCSWKSSRKNSSST